MMKSKNFFILLLVVAGGITSFLGAQFFLKLHHYFELTHQVEARFDRWDLEEKGEGKYFLVTETCFTLQGKTYRQVHRLEKPVYPNLFLAMDHKEKWKEVAKTVWVNPKKPEKASLVRLLPMKQGVHFLLALGVCFYFLWLFFYVRKVG